MLRLCFLLALATAALPVLAQSGEASVALRSDTGKYLARCYGCVPGNDNSPTNVATIHEEADDPAALPAHARFTLVPQADGRVALRTDSGMYMARCAGCTPKVQYADVNDVAFVHVRQPSEGPWALFTMNQMPNGKYTFQSDNGRYLARCNNCVVGSLQPDVAMMHTTDPNAAWAQWDVVRLDGASDGGSAVVEETMTIDGTEVRTGPIQVTLEWEGDADLDLFVTDPSGSEVGYRNTSVASGGILDVDARADCKDTGSTVENIVWRSVPPAGSYRVMVDHYAACGQEGPVAYTATLRRNGQVVDTWTGTVGAGQDETYSFESE